MLIGEFIRKLIGLVLALSLQFGAVGGVNNSSPAKNNEPISNSSCLEILPPKSTEVTFHVPETIYLKPAIGENADEFEFFIDFNNDGSLRTPQPNETETINETQNTWGNLYFYSEHASGTNVTVTVDKANFTPGSLTQTSNIYSCTIPSTGKLNTKLAPGQTEVLTWTATYYIDGVQRVAKAYTVCYAPLVEPVASGVRLTYQDNESVAWISGATGLGSGNRTARFENFAPILGVIKSSGSTSDYITGSSGGSRFGEKRGITLYNWITNASPKGSLVVDTSRYADLNQVPNLSVGFVYAKCGGNSESDWHVKNYNGQTQYGGNETGDSSNSKQREVKNSGGGAPVLASGTGNSTGVKYNNAVWSQPVSQTDEMRFRAMSYAYSGSSYRSVGVHTCYLEINKVDKGDLRNLVKEHVNLAEQAVSYAQNSVRFNAYQQAIKDAAELLGNPASNATENDIIEKFNALSKQVFSVHINHRFNNGRPMETEQAIFEAGSTVIFGLCEHTGYTPKAALGYTTSFDNQTIANCQQDIIQYYDYNANKYTVLYDGNSNTGGITLQTSHTYDVERALATNGFIKEGHNFIEWNTQADGSGIGYGSGDSVKNLTVVDGAELTLYAIWSAGDHSIIFNGNGGVGTMLNQEVEFGNSVVLNKNVYTRENYSFVSWNTNQDGSGTSYEDQALFGPMPNHDITLYAQWTINKHQITFDANGGQGGTSELMEYGQTLTSPQVTREGYEFTGWVPEVPSTVPAHDATYVAQWAVNSYEITFDANGGQGGAVYNLDFGASLTAPVVSREGYEFAGWNPEVPSTVPAQDATYVAQWNVNSYEITFDANGGEGGAVYNLDYGASLTAPVVSREGYEFAGWNPEVPSTVPAQDATYVAQWNVNSYAITFDANGGEGGAVYNLDYGASLTAPVVSREGYEFAGWNPEVPSTVPAQDATYVAQWDIYTYTITFKLENGEDDVIVSVDHGEMPEAPTGFSKEGYSFDGWDKTIVEATEDAIYTAQWAVNAYTVSFNLNGGEGTAPADQSGAPGTEVILPEQGDIVREHYNFLGWALTADATEALDSYSVGDADATLYAVWAKIPVEFFTKPDSDLIIDTSAGNIILGIKPGTSQEEFEENLVGVHGNGELRFSENDGRFGTGRKVELIDLDTEEVLDTYYIIIFGDVDGDGLVTQGDADLVMMAAAFAGEIEGGKPYEFAADLNGDGVIDAFDLNLFKAALKGVWTINPSGF